MGLVLRLGRRAIRLAARGPARARGKLLKRRWRQARRSAAPDIGGRRRRGKAHGMRVSGSTETKTYGKGAAGREREEKHTLPRRGIFGKEVDER